MRAMGAALAMYCDIDCTDIPVRSRACMVSGGCEAYVVQTYVKSG